MTAVLTERRADRSPISPPVFRLVVGTTVMATALAAATSPSDAVSLTVVAVVIVFLGIPHGAVDHLVAAPMSSTEGAKQTPARWQIRFHTGYVAAMLAYGAVWFVVPTVALVGFLLLSVHHFGQSDLAYLALERRRQLSIQFSRGVFLVGVPLVAHLSTVSPVLERLGGADPTSWMWLADHAAAWCVVLILQHVVVGALVAPGVVERSAKVREVVTVAALSALFVLSDPLIGFAVYFGLWHSLNHLHVLATELGQRAGRASIAPGELARLTAPRSVASLAGLGIFIVGFVATDRAELIVPATVVFVSMLTLPHMVVVEQLWRTRSPRS